MDIAKTAPWAVWGSKSRLALNVNNNTSIQLSKSHTLDKPNDDHDK
jgi:hypothetical protein